MKRNILITITIFICILSFIYYKESNINRDLKIDKTTALIDKSNMISIMLQTDNGYEKSSDSSWPGDSFIFNTTKSKCSNGSSVTWDSTNKKVVVEGNSSDKCTIYFDVKKMEYNYTGSEVTYTVPRTGTYKLEVWGAQGGSYNSTYIGGYGGYSEGYINLTEGDVLYITVGGEGTFYSSQADGLHNYGEGGGASYITIKSGLLSTFSSSLSDILIVAGGGGGSYYHTNGYYGSGGAGGGYIGNNGQRQDSQNTRAVTTGGTQSSGGKGSIASTFGGTGKCSGTSCGGGGFYSGGSSNGGTSDYGLMGAGGGSGYIGNSSLTNKVMYCYNCTESTDTSTRTISTTCNSSTAISNCSKSGDGYASITYISGEFDYTGTEQTYTVPKTGTYKLEVWGAQGGGNIQGYGGYSTGYVALSEGDVLYINVGGTTTDGTGGYNGGGSVTGNVYGGGGATHIATKSGLLSTLSSSISSILIVSGGGGDITSVSSNPGGNGGGYCGTDGSGDDYGYGGTQTAGGASNSSGYTNGGGAGSFGTGGSGSWSNEALGGGGGGYYGGGSAAGTDNNGSGGGGSGYIGNSLLFHKVMYCNNCSESNVVSVKTISTTNVSETPTTNYAKIGNGYAKITYLGGTS